MRGSTTRRLRACGLVFGAASLFLTAGCVSSSPSLPTASMHATASEACITATDGLGWKVAAEIDRGDASVLALTLDTGIASCLTSRGRDGYGLTSVGIGKFPAVVPSQLTYLTGVDAADGSPRVLIGRAPDGTAAVRLSFGDGLIARASLGNGMWLAWLEEPAYPTMIEAVDASGTVVDRLSNESGVRPRG